ncbi:putative B3 domain-containing protein, partial [Dichanthelium oligosanthes]
LPDKLALHFRGKIASIKVESRSGHTFDVQVAKNLGRLALQSGWEAFVSAHDLKMLDFLVFKYDGTSRMKVLIFDPSGCEKVPPCFVAENNISGRQRKEESIDISSNYANLPMETPETKKKGGKQRDGSNIMNISLLSLPSESSGGSMSSEEHEAHSVPSYILPKRTSLTDVQKKKLKEKVRAICSEIPIYGRVMKNTDISGKRTDFCVEYGDAYLPFKERTLMLHRHGKSWEVLCRVQVQRGQRNFKRLSKGWKGFARDNNLQLGDLCLFELLKTKKYMMNVHVVHEK